MKDFLKNWWPVIVLVIVGLAIILLSIPSHAEEVREEPLDDLRVNESRQEPVRADTQSWPYYLENSSFTPSHDPIWLDTLVAWNDFAVSHDETEFYVTSSTDNYVTEYRPSSSGWGIPHIYSNSNYNTIRIYGPSRWLEFIKCYYFYTGVGSDFGFPNNQYTYTSDYVQVSLNGSTVGDSWFLGGVGNSSILQYIASNSTKTVQLTYRYEVNGFSLYLADYTFAFPMSQQSMTIPWPVRTITYGGVTYGPQWAVPYQATLNLDINEPFEEFTIECMPISTWASTTGWYVTAINNAYIAGQNSVTPVTSSDISFTNMIYAVVTSPIAFIASVFSNTSIFGIPILPTLLAIITLTIAIFVIKKIRGS